MSVTLEQQPTTSDPLETARELARRFADGAAERDRDRRFPHEEMRELKRSGLLALRVPEEYGGLGGDTRIVIEAMGVLAEGDSNIAQMYMIHTYGVDLIAQSRAPREVRERFLARVVGGQFVTNAFHEVGTKTILEFRTRARRDGDGAWRLNGKKFYSTGSLAGDFMYVVTLTDEPEPQFRVGLVDTTAPGVTIHDDWRGMGQRTTASGTIELEEVPVEDEALLAVDDLLAPDSLFGNFGQLAFSAIFVGMAKGALADALEFVRTRTRPWVHSAVDRATEDPYVLLRVGQMETLITSAEAVVDRALGVRMEAERDLSPAARDRASVAAAQAKVITGEAALRVSELMFQVCGTGSVLETYNFDRHWRNARTLTLHDPMDYKVRLTGDYVLNGTPPPISPYT